MGLGREKRMSFFALALLCCCIPMVQSMRQCSLEIKEFTSSRCSVFAGYQEKGSFSTAQTKPVFVRELDLGKVLLGASKANHWQSIKALSR